MAVLQDTDRADVWADYMRDARVGVTGALAKADLRAAVDSLDNFLSANAAAVNSAIPQPARGVLTAPQKALLLSAVVLKRYVKGV